MYDDLDELPAPPRKDIPEADRELLELAAKATGIDGKYLADAGGGAIVYWTQPQYVDQPPGAVFWKPLTDDGAALRLAVRLNLWPKRDQWSDGEYIVVALPDGGIEAEPVVGDALATTRRAIVRAAAEIGRKQT